VSGEGYEQIDRGDAYRLYMSETMSISASACAIFCSDESCGRPPKRKDIVCVGGVDWLVMYMRVKVEIRFNPMEELRGGELM
jgi:hypothetical protein